MSTSKKALHDPYSNTAENPATSQGASTACHKGGGPRTEIGKKKSRMNALKHGIFAQELHLAPDEQKEYNALRMSLEQDLKPNTALLMLLFDNFLSTTWRMKIADRCVQDEIEKRLGNEPREIPQIEVASCEMSYPFQLTAFELRRRIISLGEIADQFNRYGRLTAEWERVVEKTLGTEFSKILQNWKPVDPVLILMDTTMLAKQKLYDLTPIVPPPTDATTEEYRAIEDRLRAQMIVKLIQMKREEFQLALRVVQGTDATVVKDRLEILLRYQAVARRDFYRALDEYRELKWPHKQSR